MQEVSVNVGLWEGYVNSFLESSADPKRFLLAFTSQLETSARRLSMTILVVQYILELVPWRLLSF